LLEIHWQELKRHLHFLLQQASDDEFEMRADRVKPFVSPDGGVTDPWRCLRGCDKEASCRGVFVTKVELDWACWFVRGAFGLGSTASSIKAVPGQINTYFWLGTLRTDNTTQVGLAEIREAVEIQRRCACQHMCLQNTWISLCYHSLAQSVRLLA
jgi:hypothetical protein